MARTYRSNSSSSEKPAVPKSYGKTTDYSSNNKLKKNGSGKYNWGNANDDIDDFEESSDIAFAHSRRRSNSSSNFGSRPAGDLSSREYYDVFDEQEEN